MQVVGHHQDKKFWTTHAQRNHWRHCRSHASSALPCPVGISSPLPTILENHVPYSTYIVQKPVVFAMMKDHPETLNLPR